jgi:glucose-1-phosphate adenylyltransferase
MYAYDFQRNHIPGDPADQEPYWRDVGTIDSYFDANMDLRSLTPQLNLYNRRWPLRTAGYEDAPAKFVLDEDGGRRGEAINSIVCGGSIVSGGLVRNSVLGRGVRVNDFSQVDDSIIFDNCIIGKRAKIRRAILDKNVVVPDGITIGYDVESDRKLYHVTESGIVVVEGRRSSVDVGSLIV